MRADAHLDPSVIVIFGIGGDLAWRKLVPALYKLFRADSLPVQFAIVGLDVKAMADEQMMTRLRDGVARSADIAEVTDECWQSFATHFSALHGDFQDAHTYGRLAARLGDLDRDWNTQANHIFYLAVPPSLIQPIVKHLAEAGLARRRRGARVVVEKPFGHDLESAHALNQVLTDVFEERQIFRIDHYLGKETVQNILAFRFANAMFEPIWNRRYIDHVQITVAEDVGIEHRGLYYEKAGALRDMVQNHLLQLACLIAMEPPVAFRDQDIGNKKVELLQAVRPISPEEVPLFAVRGQYDAGWLHGQHVSAYREELDVAAESSAETYAAVKLFIDNWRWHGVPFYLRTGKRMAARVSEVVVQFRPVPHQPFPPLAVMDLQPNTLNMRIQPDEGISLHFQAKQPGLAMRLRPVHMQFSYAEAFKVTPPEAYETLLLDVLLGDSTLFMRADQAEAAWRLVDPILDVWSSIPPGDFPNYPAGMWGPESAQVLLARDGRSWVSTIARP
jgi:glucose-6-phosphate 1-dehydrogenase